MRVIISRGIILVIALCCLLSCGLEAFYYIDYIPQPPSYDTTESIIQLPSSGREGYSAYFENFIIFYRIYISASHISGKIDTYTDRREINSALDGDFGSFFPYTEINSTSASTTNLENTFLNRKYYKLELEGVNINSVLGKSSLGSTLKISFPPNNKPLLTLNNTEYTLQRAVPRVGTGGFELKPNRDFFNHQELYNNANATNEINADTAPNSGANMNTTYVSMYIAAKGSDFLTLIYSQPTHIGIFQLASSM